MKVWAFYESQKQVKGDIENYRCIFQIEGDGGIGGKCTCVLFTAINKEWSNSKTAGLFCLNLGRRKQKILVGPSSELNVFFSSIYLILDRGKALFSCILDPEFREIRLPILARVLQYFVRDGVTWVCWAALMESCDMPSAKSDVNGPKKKIYFGDFELEIDKNTKL